MNAPCAACVSFCTGANGFREVKQLAQSHTAVQQEALPASGARCPGPAVCPLTTCIALCKLCRGGARGLGAGGGVCRDLLKPLWPSHAAGMGVPKRNVPRSVRSPMGGGQERGLCSGKSWRTHGGRRDSGPGLGRLQNSAPARRSRDTLPGMLSSPGTSGKGGRRRVPVAHVELPSNPLGAHTPTSPQSLYQDKVRSPQEPQAS